MPDLRYSKFTSALSFISKQSLHFSRTKPQPCNTCQLRHTSSCLRIVIIFILKLWTFQL